MLSGGVIIRDIPISRNISSSVVKKRNRYSYKQLKNEVKDKTRFSRNVIRCISR